MVCHPKIFANQMKSVNALIYFEWIGKVLECNITNSVEFNDNNLIAVGGITCCWFGSISLGPNLTSPASATAKLYILILILSNNLLFDLLLIGWWVLLQKNSTTKLASIFLCATFSKRRETRDRRKGAWERGRLPAILQDLTFVSKRF